MLADLDLLLITVYCAADDTLPKAAANARRRVTDAEIVTLAVAQAVLDIRLIGHSCGPRRAAWAGSFPSCRARTVTGSGAPDWPRRSRR